MADFHKPTSPYRKTPVRDFYLDLWKQPTISLDGAEEREIDHRYDRRPDLMAYDLYGTPNLWWVFAVTNKDLLMDPSDDFVAGLKIMVPSNKEVSKLL
jgi:hypothetical protein